VEYNFQKEGYEYVRDQPYTADGGLQEVRLARSPSNAGRAD
jgi:hypothetical protein